MSETEKETALLAVRSNVELDAMAYMLFLETWTQAGESISEFDDDLLKSLRDKWEGQWLPSRTEPHCGDCTNVCAPCVRCGVERLYADAMRILNASNDTGERQTTAQEKR